MKAGIVGASGYLGAELLRLLAVHPDLSVEHVQGESSAGTALADLYPGLSGAYKDLQISAVDYGALGTCDVVFVAVPSGTSQDIVANLYGKVPCVVDLGADFRLKNPSLYDTWYHFTHSAPELLAKSVFGLPELFRDEIVSAQLVAAPGCYVTASSLALAPFVRSGLIEASGIIIDAASGTSGAGRSPSEAMHHGTVNENFTAYGLLSHRHTPEIEQTIGAQVLFTPHLAPMTRGILATCYARPKSALTTAQAIAFLQETYEGETFVTVSEHIPTTRGSYGSNMARMTARVDDRTGWLMVLCAIDNLTKGGAGQALQAANVALGLNESAGLPVVAVMP